MILVAAGSNLPNADHRFPLDTVHWAIARLAMLPKLRLRAISRPFSSPAWPPSDQPDYVNAVVRLEGEADPAPLLEILHELEAEAGRMRGAPNAARTLDLDLLAVGDLVRGGPGPVLPHPRMHERAFVLAPLCDVAPDWVHPVLGRSARELLAALPNAGAAKPLPSAGAVPISTPYA